MVELEPMMSTEYRYDDAPPREPTSTRVKPAVDEREQKEAQNMEKEARQVLDKIWQGNGQQSFEDVSSKFQKFQTRSSLWNDSCTVVPHVYCNSSGGPSALDEDTPNKVAHYLQKSDKMFFCRKNGYMPIYVSKLNPPEKDYGVLKHSKNLQRCLGQTHHHQAKTEVRHRFNPKDIEGQNRGGAAQETAKRRADTLFYSREIFHCQDGNQPAQSQQFDTGRDNSDGYNPKVPVSDVRRYVEPTHRGRSDTKGHARAETTGPIPKLKAGALESRRTEVGRKYERRELVGCDTGAPVVAPAMPFSKPASVRCTKRSNGDLWRNSHVAVREASVNAGKTDHPTRWEAIAPKPTLGHRDAHGTRVPSSELHVRKRDAETVDGSTLRTEGDVYNFANDEKPRVSLSQNDAHRTEAADARGDRFAAAPTVHGHAACTGQDAVNVDVAPAEAITIAPASRQYDFTRAGGEDTEASYTQAAHMNVAPPVEPAVFVAEGDDASVFVARSEAHALQPALSATPNVCADRTQAAGDPRGAASHSQAPKLHAEAHDMLLQCRHAEEDPNPRFAQQHGAAVASAVHASNGARAPSKEIAREHFSLAGSDFSTMVAHTATDDRYATARSHARQAYLNGPSHSIQARPVRAQAVANLCLSGTHKMLSRLNSRPCKRPSDIPSVKIEPEHSHKTRVVPIFAGIHSGQVINDSAAVHGKVSCSKNAGR